MLAIYNASYTKVGLIYSLDKHPVIPYCYKAICNIHTCLLLEKKMRLISHLKTLLIRLLQSV